jgi:hypothetical protein
MGNLHKEGDIVRYVGSNDMWNQACCIGALYRVIKVYPPVGRMYYYDLETIDEDWTPLEDRYFKEMFSVREYQLESL